MIKFVRPLFLSAIVIIAIQQNALAAGGLDEETVKIIISALECSDGGSIDMVAGITRKDGGFDGSVDTPFLQSLKKQGVKIHSNTYTLPSPISVLGYSVKKYLVESTEEGATVISFQIPAVNDQLRTRLQNPAITGADKVERRISVSELQKNKKYVACEF